VHSIAHTLCITTYINTCKQYNKNIHVCLHSNTHALTFIQIHAHINSQNSEVSTYCKIGAHPVENPACNPTIVV